MKEYVQLPEVRCYPGQLNQVFMNRIANAIDAFDEFNAGRDYNEIKANPNRIVIPTEVNQSNHQVVIRIADNRPGMPESVKQRCARGSASSAPRVHRRIFDHLFTNKAVGKGTGLGLLISRQLVAEKHGGQLCGVSGRLIALPRRHWTVIAPRE